MYDLITSTTSFQWVIPLTWNTIILTIDAGLALVVGAGVYTVYKSWQR